MNENQPNTDVSESTIAALSTPAGRGGLHVIRMSGPDAAAIADRVFHAASGKPLSKTTPRQAVFGSVWDKDGRKIDECLALYLRGPHSFTGEDTVEIDCHGGMYLVRCILESLMHSGAEMAQPGEFSKRAFLNGKMDLNEAEAVMDMIDARTSYSLQAAVSQLSGKLSRKTESLRQELIHIIADTEVNLDYPEYDDLPEITDESIQKRCAAVCQEAQKLLDTADSGQLLREGIRIAIIGRPNVGKSSLLNQLLGTDRAIVTDIPGTTRDTLEEYADLDGIACRLIDTAGIRQTSDAVEKLGVDRAVSSIAKANLVLLVLDASQPLDEEDKQLLLKIQDRPRIILLNKEDLSQKTLSPADTARELSEVSGRKETVLPISASTGEGLQELKDTVRHMFFTEEVLSPDTPLVTNLRQKQALVKCTRALARVRQAVGMPQDLLLIDITEAADALGEMTGQNAREDAITEIFSRFCLGK